MAPVILWMSQSAHANSAPPIPRNGRSRTTSRASRSRSIFDRPLEGAKEIVRGAARYTKESDAEAFLRADKFKSAPLSKPFLSTAEGKRALDIVEPPGTGVEVKFGKVHNAGRANVQAKRDAALIAEGEIDEVEWHFFANSRGVFGPDEDLLSHLRSLGIPYVVHLPS